MNEIKKETGERYKERRKKAKRMRKFIEIKFNIQERILKM